MKEVLEFHAVLNDDGSLDTTYLVQCQASTLIKVVRELISELLKPLFGPARGPEDRFKLLLDTLITLIDTAIPEEEEKNDNRE